jgi:hypothetical protein
MVQCATTKLHQPHEIPPSPGQMQLESRETVARPGSKNGLQWSAPCAWARLKVRLWEGLHREIHPRGSCATCERGGKHPQLTTCLDIVHLSALLQCISHLLGSAVHLMTPSLPAHSLSTVSAQHLAGGNSNSSGNKRRTTDRISDGWS